MNPYISRKQSPLAKCMSFIRLYCPVCGNGKIFHGYFDTPITCPSCGYYFMRETGYFLPHVPIGYVAMVAAGLGSWPILEYLGLQSRAWTLAIMVAITLAFGVWSLRYAKMIWLLIDLYMVPPAKEDFEPRGRAKQ